MRTILLSLSVLLCMAVHAQEPSALLMVHFGTTYDDTRAKTIDAINERARQACPGYELAEAYTSAVVMKRLARRGVVKPSVTDALLQLRAKGFLSVVVQPTYIIDGIEMQRLRSDVDRLRPFFNDIRLSTPLLYTTDDARRVCNVLVARHPANQKKREHVVFVGHGTEGPATALYSQLDYMLHADPFGNGREGAYHVATIEGYPTLQTLTDELHAQRAKSVKLVPLLFVAGDHATNDIAVEWREALEREGFAVSLAIEGLGEVPEIQNLYIEKIKGE